MLKSKKAKKAEKTTKKVAKKETKKATKPAAKKPAAKKPVAKKSTKKPEPTNIYYVSVRFDGKNKEGWEIKRGNASKVTAVCKNKEEAKEKVKSLAKNSEATVIIYKMDGKIDETYKLAGKKK